MTKIIPVFFTLLFLCSFSLLAQTVDCDEPFVYYYGEGADYDARTLLSQDSFLYMGGQRDQEAFLAKLTTEGSLIWVRSLQTTDLLSHTIVDLKLASDGSLIGCGQAGTGSDVASFAFKVNPDDGTVIWTQTYQDPDSDYFTVSDIFENTNNSGTYTLLGTAYNLTVSVGCDAAFYTIDSNDGTIASERINYHLGSCEGITSTILRNNLFYVTGRYNFANGGVNRMRPAITAINSTGTALWSRLYLVGVNQDARLYSQDIALDGPNNLIALAWGDDNGVSTDNADVWIYRTNLAGGAQWAIKYTLPESVIGEEIVVVENGYLIVASARTSDRTYVMRVNGAGTPIWGKQLDGIKTDGLGDELLTIGNQAYLAGQYIGTTNDHAALLRFDIATGELPSACIENIDFTPEMTFITAPYDGFNALSNYNTSISEDSSFDLNDSTLDALLSSCGPACGPEICDNDIDDDGDGLIDCDDPDVADDCCCFEAPQLNLGGNISFCAGETAELDAGSGFETYEWSDGSNEQTLSINNGGAYYLTVTDICNEEQVDSVFATVLPSFISSQSITICEGEMANVFGNPETMPGEYSMTFSAGNGCDSTHTITLSVLERFNTNEELTICEGSSVEVFGELVTDAGTYEAEFTAANGCDSTHTVTVFVEDFFMTNESLSICEGESIEIFGEEVTEAGAYSMTFTSTEDCDSTHTVNLTVLEVFTTSEDRTICSGESTEIFGQEETESGAYSMTFESANGCDSTHTVNLTVLEVFTTSEDRTICSGESTDIFGQEETESGAYSMTFTTSNGCDSTHTIMLTVIDPVVTTEEITICPDESIDIFGETVSEEGEYSMTFTAENGCDSTHIITLNSETFGANANIYPPCPGDPMLGWLVYINTSGNGGPYTVTYNGQLAYSNTIGGLQPGDHTAQVTSANGCEYTVEFTIRDYSNPWSPLIAQTPSGDLPNGGSIEVEVADDLGPITFSLDGISYYEKPVFEGLTKGEYTLFVDYGGYCSFSTPVNVPGISDDQLSNSTANLYTDQDSNHTDLSLDIASELSWKIYPNPTQNAFRILGAEQLHLKTIRLLNLTGSPVRSWNAVNVNNTLHLPTHLSSGIYLVEVTTVDGKLEYQKLVITK